MIRVTKTFIRPNTNVDWWFNTPAGAAYTAYRSSVYGAKITDPSSVLSEDGLTWTYSNTWSSQEDFDAMLADSATQEALADYEAYNLVHGITDTTTITSL